MSWFSKLFSSVGVSVAEVAGKVADNLFTSDEEIALTEIEKLKIKSALEVELKRQFVQLDRQQAEHEENLEAELTQRLQLDMKSDSWLSKNIRPMALAFLTFVVSIMAFFTVFDDKLTKPQLAAMEQWIPFFTTIMLTVYGFYFGSRGIEKIQKIRGAVEVEKSNKVQFHATQSPEG